MKFLVVILLAAAVSADVRDALRNSRQAIILNPQQLVQLQQPQQLVQLQRPQQLVQLRQPQQLVQLRQPQQLVQLQQPQLQLVTRQPAFLQQSFQQAAAAQPNWRILQQTQEVDPAGNYRYSFETENGIRAAEEGVVINAGTNAESTAKQGNFAYTAPDGTPISLSYVADENGFRASGEHLPTPPPIPEAILRSLEQNAREEAAGFFSK